MQEFYESIAAALNAHGVQCVIRSEKQMIVSWQSGPAWPDRGNSFWLSINNVATLIWTWAPRRYLAPRNIDIVGFCLEFLNVGTMAQPTIPPALVTKYQLKELDEEAINQYFGPDDECDEDDVRASE